MGIAQDRENLLILPAVIVPPCARNWSILTVGLCCFEAPAAANEVEPVPLEIEMLTSIGGRSPQWDWWQARSACVPGEKPQWITTMSETGRSGTHNFHDIYQAVSRDGGRSWSEPALIPSLRRTRQPDGYEVAAGDLWPTWHSESGKVIATGKTFNFAGGEHEDRMREKVSYAVMNPMTGAWGPMRFLEMPEKDHAGNVITAANAGCTQRVDLPRGDILLPVRYLADRKKQNYTSIVVRCGFDGETLTYQKHGSELTIPQGRGLYEPSLTRYRGEYFLTLRADHSAFVTRSRDGLHFDPIREWQFDDGEPLGNYNTQQHWMTAGGGLFLVYTRRGAGNDHIFRHRAPLFIAQVNPETLRVLRDTERVLLPANDATLGNSGVCRISADESWVTCGEGHLRLGKRKNGLNKVFFVKVTTPQAAERKKAARPFNHPGILHSRAELEFVKGKVQAGEEPWKTAWEALRAHPLASLDWQPKAHPHITRGPRARPRVGASEMMSDAAAACTHALAWWISGNGAHARKAIEILDDYADTVQSVREHDARLLVGMTAIQFVSAAELIAHGEAEWGAEQRAAFARMLRKVFHPVIKDFFPTANGNWDASMIQSQMAMGVYLDDHAMFQRGVDYFLEGRGNGCIFNYVRPSGQCQESGRDQHHTQMGLGFLAFAAEIAWKQGVDLYQAGGNLLAAGFEYNANYNLGNEVPFERFVSVDGRYDHKKISAAGRGTWAPVFEVPYRHYHRRAGLAMPFTAQVIGKVRPEKNSTVYSPWTTLMFAEVPGR